MSAYTIGVSKKAYENIKKKFFSRYDLVISMPHVLRRGHNLHKNEDALLIKQKLPAFMFLGARKSEETSGVRLTSAEVYEPQEKTYILVDGTQIFSEQQLQHLEEILEGVMDELGISYGLDVGIFSDVKRGWGFGFMGLFCTLLASSLYVVSGRLERKHLENYEDFITSSLKDEIIGLALHIDTQRSGSPYGVSPFVSLASHDQPYVQFGRLGYVKNKKSPVSYISNRTPRPLGLSEIMETHFSFNDLPIDFGIISCGISYDTRKIRSKHTYFQQTYSQMVEFSEGLNAVFHLSSDHILDPSFSVNTLSNFLSVSLLRAWKSMMTNLGQASYVDEFIQAVSDIGMYDVLLEKEKQDLIYLYYHFDLLKRSTRERVAFLPLSSSQTGGTYLFVTHYNKSRVTIDRLLEKLDTDGIDVCYCPYVSRVHGTTSAGLQIHQFISNKQYSQYVKKGAIYYRKGAGEKIVTTYAEVLSQDRKGVLLDSVYMKVHLPGAKLTHKEIYSQIATVEILGILLEKKGSFIHNSQLPVSSYSKNKNEMVGKIVMPLKALILKRLKKEIDIECNGSIYDFYIRIADDKGVFEQIAPLD